LLFSKGKYNVRNKAFYIASVLGSNSDRWAFFEDVKVRYHNFEIIAS